MWTVVAALAVWATTSGAANAQRHGGGWSGGGHQGGGWSGGHQGGGWSGGHQGGGWYGGSGWHGGYSGYGHSYGYYPHQSGLSIGFYAGPSYGYRPYSYGSYPSYYASGYSGYYYPSPAYYGDEYVPSDATITRSGYYAPSTDALAASDNRARIHVRLPADATLWVDGDATQQAGAERDFTTPPLTPGTTYQYTLKARWMQGNDPVEKTMKVDVRANETSQADFMR